MFFWSSDVPRDRKMVSSTALWLTVGQNLATQQSNELLPGAETLDTELRIVVAMGGPALRALCSKSIEEN
jgi:hypothetical protein